MASIKGRYARIEVSLDETESDKELFISGDYLSIISISGEGSCELKLDHRHSQTINLREITGITGVFERVFFSTNGAGGVCTMFVGTGLAITISPDPEKLFRGGTACTQVTTLTSTVLGLASEPFKLRDVTILNSNGVYACYVGSYNSVAATFKAYAYVLLPHQTLKFGLVDMYSLGTISYDGTHNVILDLIGVYE